MVVASVGAFAIGHWIALGAFKGEDVPKLESRAMIRLQQRHLAAKSPHTDRAHTSIVAARSDAASVEERSNAPIAQFRWHKRDASEWQGMPVDLSSTPGCFEGFCQGALACIDNQCAPCERDTQCLDGEVCVLDYCVRAELATCHRAADCPVGEVCILTGLSEDQQRENSTMRSLCSGSRESTIQPVGQLPAELFVGRETVHNRMNNVLNSVTTP